MSDCSSHDQAIPVATDIGIVRQGTFDAAAFERAIADLLGACGLDAAGPHMGRTPQRVRELWQRRLLGGYDLDPAEALGEGFADPRGDMVVVRGIAVHGVCPHHLVPFPWPGPRRLPARRPAARLWSHCPAWSTPLATASPIRNG
jgi:GTP cyclohydrolase I